MRSISAVVVLALLTACAESKPEQPVRSTSQPQTRTQTQVLTQQQAEAKGWTVPDKAQNYCFTNLRGKKTWSSFIWRGDELKVSPRDRTQRVALYGPAGDAVWKDKKGTGTYEFFKGGATWRANNGSGKSIQLREC